MLRASALYVVIVVSLMIAILSASLIATAFFYRSEHQKSKRYSRLLGNMNSAYAILLSRNFVQYDSYQVLDLYGDQQDSVGLALERWGIFDLGIARAFKGNDTLRRSFLIGQNSRYDHTALYLTDENRPLSVSGDTRIRGNAELPKSGIKQAYVDGRPYSGKKLVEGTVRNSSSKLTPPVNDVITSLRKGFNKDEALLYRKLPAYAFNSFFNPVMHIKLNAAETVTSRLEGKIMLLSDTTVHIGRQAELKDVLVFAPSIIVEDGFKGSCQLYASDSIIIGKNAVFTYPSCLGVLKKPGGQNQPLISIGANTVVNGFLFGFEDTKSALQTMISLGKNSTISGEVYAGLIKMDSPVRINGKASCNRFIIRTSASLYENYLIDVILDRGGRSRYYLSPVLFSSLNSERGIVKWIK